MRRIENIVVVSLCLLVWLSIGCFLRDDKSDERMFYGVISPNLEFAACAGTGGFGIYDFNQKEMRHINRFVSPECLAVSNDSQFIALGLWSENSCDMTTDAKIQIIQSSTGKVLSEFKGHKGSVNGVTFSPDSKYIASCGDDSMVKIWDIDNRESLMDITVHSNRIDCATYSPDGKFIAIGAADSKNKGNVIKVLNASSGEIKYEINSPEYCYINSLSYSASGQKLAAVLSINTINIWNLSKENTPYLELSCDDKHCNKQRGLFDSDNDRSYPYNAGGFIDKILFMPDENQFISWGHRGFRIYSIRTGEDIIKTKYHGGDLFDLRLIHDGTQICTIGEDESIRFWDIKSKAEIKKIRGLTLRLTWHWNLVFILMVCWLPFYLIFIFKENNKRHDSETLGVTISKFLISSIAIFSFLFIIGVYPGSFIYDFSEGFIEIFLFALIGSYFLNFVLIFISLKYFKFHKVNIIFSAIIISTYTIFAGYMFWEALGAI